MPNRVALIDYGVGNLRSVGKALQQLGCCVDVTNEPNSLAQADKLVLPGVGAFGAGIANLKRLRLVDPIHQFASTGKPLLGICLGMQLLLTESSEMGHHKGLDLIPGKVVRFPNLEDLTIPHMGWKTLSPCQPTPLFSGLSNQPMVYFVHSYYVAPTNKKIQAATTKHGLEFCSVLICDNIFGTQFHPEKSSKVGLTMLKNFVEM